MAFAVQSQTVLGQPIDRPEDIGRIATRVGYDSMDLLHAPHTWSGIEMALWTCWAERSGRASVAPAGVSGLLQEAAVRIPIVRRHAGRDTAGGSRRARPRLHGSQVRLGSDRTRAGADQDTDQLVAAREGLGSDGVLFVDVGQIWGNDVEAAAARLPALEAARATWLEEPFSAHALEAYSALSGRSKQVRLAGGEAAHNFHMARHLIDYGGVRFIQIDTGRIGGIGPAKQVADYAVAHGVTFVVPHVHVSSRA